MPVNTCGLEGKYVALDLSSGSQICGRVSRMCRESPCGEMELADAWMSRDYSLSIMRKDYVQMYREEKKRLQVYRIVVEHIVAMQVFDMEDASESGNPGQ